MLDLLSLTSTFFGIILAGALGKYLGWFSSDCGRALSRFAFFVALPPLMFIAIISKPIADVLSPGFIIRYEVCTLLIFALAFLFAQYVFQLEGKSRAIFSLNASFPNYGFIGIPLVFLLFGDQAAIPVALILVFDAILLLSLVSIFSSYGGQYSSSQNLTFTIRSLVTNPLLVSALAGLIFSFTGLELWHFPETTFNILAGAAAPTALFALGINLVEKPKPSDVREITFLALTKLIIHPILLLCLFMFWPLTGEEKIPDMWISVAVILASLPIAANAYALSEYYKSYSRKTSAAIFVSTIFGSLTVVAFIYLVSIKFGV